MTVRNHFRYRVALTALFALSSAIALALPVVPVNLDTLSLGARIVGPVGPTVDASFIDGDGASLGDLQSSVSCPDGFAACTPPTNPPGTIYTYVHEVTPGVDFPNDPPFPQPGTVLPINGATGFALGFAAAGFNGVAGYSFGDATSALVGGSVISIELETNGSLAWALPSAAGWDSGERIAFFWQTTQAPSGPGGQYLLTATALSGSGAGPLPLPVPEPGTLVLMALGVAFLLWPTAVAALRRR